jgi:FKBP-type peptidyl-prolyl cis-trans isomerase
MDGYMKKKTMLLMSTGISAIIICLFLLGGCKKTADAPNSFTFDKDASYAVGMYIATQFQVSDLHYDYQSFMEGFRAYNEAQETRFTMEEAITKINDAFMSYENWYMTMSSEEAKKNLEAGTAYLAENAKRPGVNTLPSGLQYEVLSQGNGIRPAATDLVQVHYEGTLIDGTVFDSSYVWGEPVKFHLNEVIQGWTEGLQLMSEGSSFKFYIPPDLGYGPMPQEVIPGNSVLIFRVELLAIVAE